MLSLDWITIFQNMFRWISVNRPSLVIVLVFVFGLIVFKQIHLILNLSPATLAHTFWFWPKLSGYWSSIFNALSKIFKSPINPNPLTAIFGIKCEDDHPPRAQSDCIAFVTLLARRIIPLNWKQATPSSYKHWVRDTLHLLKLEKIRLALQHPNENFTRIWQTFIT